MAALKYIGTMMMVPGRGQVRVAAKTTYADFMAMSGVSRGYLGETGNLIEIAWLDALPAQMIYVFGDHPRADTKPDMVPVERLMYLSAKDKVLKKAEQDRARETQKIMRAERLKTERDVEYEGRVERVAKILYDLDLRNEPWDDADETVTSGYRQKAVVVLSVM